MELNQILNKAVKGLYCCILRDPDDKPRCSECPYDGACANRLKQDALYLLQKQQNDIHLLKSKDHLYCGKLRKNHDRSLLQFVS